MHQLEHWKKVACGRKHVRCSQKRVQCLVNSVSEACLFFSDDNQKRRRAASVVSAAPKAPTATPAAMAYSTMQLQHVQQLEQLKREMQDMTQQQSTSCQKLKYIEERQSKTLTEGACRMLSNKFYGFDPITHKLSSTFQQRWTARQWRWAMEMLVSTSSSLEHMWLAGASCTLTAAREIATYVDKKDSKATTADELKDLFSNVMILHCCKQLSAADEQKQMSSEQMASLLSMDWGVQKKKTLEQAPQWYFTAVQAEERVKEVREKSQKAQEVVQTLLEQDSSISIQELYQKTGFPEPTIAGQK